MCRVAILAKIELINNVKGRTALNKDAAEFEPVQRNDDTELADIREIGFSTLSGLNDIMIAVNGGREFRPIDRQILRNLRRNRRDSFRTARPAGLSGPVCSELPRMKEIEPDRLARRVKTPDRRQIEIRRFRN